MAAASGREQRSRTATARARTPDLGRFYRYRRPPVTPGDFTFHLDLLRPSRPPFALDRMTNQLTWDDEQATLTGSLIAYRPDLEDPRSLPIARGHLVRCRVGWAGGTYRLWTMRCQAPQVEVETGQVTVTLQDDMALLDSSEFDWWFRKTRHRPHGYTCDEIAVAVAARLGVRVRVAAKGTVRFALKMRGASGLAVLRAAYQHEKDHSGRSFIVRLRDGELEVVPLARNPLLYVLARQIQTAAITQKAGQKVPTTVLTGRGRVGHGKTTRSVSYTDYDRLLVEQLGYVHATRNFGRVESLADLRDRVRRELAARLRFNDTISVTHQGIPFILRGDGVQIGLPSEGYRGSDSFVYCSRAVHTVQAGVYTTQWDFVATDPYAATVRTKAVVAAKRRAAKRGQRKRSRLAAGHA